MSTPKPTQRGRRLLDAERGKRVQLTTRVFEDQKEAFHELGGAQWLSAEIDRAILELKSAKKTAKR